jgi:GTP-binding protein
MIDAMKGMSSQDINILHLCEKNRKGIVILVNKWDLVEKDTHSTRMFEEDIHARIRPFEDIPIVFTSVTEKQRIHKALETALKVYSNKTKKVPTSKLNKVLLPYIDNNPPPATKGKSINIKYITQLPGYAPTFVFFSTHPQYIKDQYKRFLENKLREHFDFSGVPISIYFRNKEKGVDE